MMAYYQSHLNLLGREQRKCANCGREQTFSRHQKGKTLNCQFCKATLPSAKPESELPSPRARRKKF